MGTGDVHWPPVWRAICGAKNVSFIPEIWQGHKDHGAGFWHALNMLSDINKDH
jgi:N-acetylneuraminate synthase